MDGEGDVRDAYKFLFDDHCDGAVNDLLDCGSQSMPKIFIEVDWNCQLIDLFALYFSFVSGQHAISGILGLAFNFSLWNSHGLAFFTPRHM